MGFILSDFLKGCGPVALAIRPWLSFNPTGEFVECGDSSPHGSESGDKSPHSTFGGLNDDQGRQRHP